MSVTLLVNMALTLRKMSIYIIIDRLHCSDYWIVVHNEFTEKVIMYYTLSEYNLPFSSQSETVSMSQRLNHFT